MSPNADENLNKRKFFWWASNLRKAIDMLKWANKYVLTIVPDHRSAIFPLLQL